MSASYPMQPVTREELKAKLIEHMVKHCGCSEEHARITVGEFADPFHNLYLQTKPVPAFTQEIQGEQYEMLLAATKEYVGDIRVKPQFTFFVLYRSGDLQNHTDEEYRTARRIYMTTDILPFV